MGGRERAKIRMTKAKMENKPSEVRVVPGFALPVIRRRRASAHAARALSGPHVAGLKWPSKMLNSGGGRGIGRNKVFTGRKKKWPVRTTDGRRWGCQHWGDASREIPCPSYFFCAVCAIHAMLTDEQNGREKIDAGALGTAGVAQSLRSEVPVGITRHDRLRPRFAAARAESRAR